MRTGEKLPHPLKTRKSGSTTALLLRFDRGLKFRRETCLSAEESDLETPALCILEKLNFKSSQRTSQTQYRLGMQLGYP